MLASLVLSNGDKLVEVLYDEAELSKIYRRITSHCAIETDKHRSEFEPIEEELMDVEELSDRSM